ncbi:Kynurenine formamidase [bioreactor metagenome]|uniref:Kynurenine formamidase n=1 Tax=bioreactor metagenome TaxID=1076179 RepID=A0A644YCJ4_9ZZZZ|nr:cyclase family protein [Candidatus Metalachnospira sp.]
MMIDITRPLTESIYVYDGDPCFKTEKVLSIQRGDICNVAFLQMGTHTGTHIDAPKHFFNDSMDILSLPLDCFCGKAKVFDIQTTHDISEAELYNKNIEENDIILFRTSNIRFDGINSLVDYSALTPDAATYLLKKKIKLVGIDYLSIESSTSNTYYIHKILLRNNIPILENIDLKDVAEGIYKLYCFPLAIHDGDASPVRAVLETI